MKKNKKSAKKSPRSNVAVSTSAVPSLSDVRAVPTLTAVPNPEPALVDPSVDTVSVSQADGERIQGKDRSLATGKLQLAELEIQIMELQSRKSELLTSMKSINQDMADDISKLATSLGIDVTGTKDSRKWVYNTTEMTFKTQQ